MFLDFSPAKTLDVGFWISMIEIRYRDYSVLIRNECYVIYLRLSVDNSANRRFGVSELAKTWVINYHKSAPESGYKNCSSRPPPSKSPMNRDFCLAERNYWRNFESIVFEIIFFRFNYFPSFANALLGASG